MALRLRRGTDVERQTITPLSGELLYITDTGLVYVGDGSTQGGSVVGGNLEADNNPILSANLNLNGNSIIGNGNIDIDGNITATGNITIGDGVEDNIIVGGTISSSLIPTDNSAFDLGSETFQWRNGYFTGLLVNGEISATSLSVDGEISATSLSIDTIISADSSVIYDSLTQTFNGNLNGSLIADDSIVIIDSDTGNATLSNIIADSIVSENIVTDTLSVLNGILSYSLITAQNLEANNVKSAEANISNILTEGYTELGQGQVVIQRVTSDDTSSDQIAYGNITFRVNDANGQSLDKTLIQAGRRYIRFINDANDIIPGVSPTTTTLSWVDNKLVVGGRNTTAPERLQVIGDASITGYLQTEQIRISGNSIQSTESNANIELIPNGSGTIELSVPEQSTVGAGGGASALPASPSIYFKVNINGTDYVIPAFAVT